MLEQVEQQAQDKQHSKAVVATFGRYESWCMKEQVYSRILLSACEK